MKNLYSTKKLKTLFLTLILTIGFTSTSFAVKDSLVLNGNYVTNPQGVTLVSLNTNVGDTLVMVNGTPVTVTYVINTTTITSVPSGSIFTYKVKPTDVPNFHINWNVGPYNNSFLVNVNTSTTGINDNIDKIQFNAFPNPVTDVLTIKGPTNLGTINIFSLTGQIVFSDVVKEISTRVDFSVLPAGIYFVRVGDVIRKVIRK